MKILDKDEAPPGYYAALKSDVPAHVGNICRACDWRAECSGEVYRCMPGEIDARGSTLKRNDGCSVVFKRREAQ